MGNLTRDMTRLREEIDRLRGARRDQLQELLQTTRARVDQVADLRRKLAADREALARSSADDRRKFVMDISYSIRSSLENYTQDRQRGAQQDQQDRQSFLAGVRRQVADLSQGVQAFCQNMRGDLSGVRMAWQSLHSVEPGVAEEPPPESVKTEPPPSSVTKIVSAELAETPGPQAATLAIEFGAETETPRARETPIVEEPARPVYGNKPDTKPASSALPSSAATTAAANATAAPATAGQSPATTVTESKADTQAAETRANKQQAPEQKSDSSIKSHEKLSEKKSGSVGTNGPQTGAAKTLTTAPKSRRRGSIREKS